MTKGKELGFLTIRRQKGGNCGDSRVASPVHRASEGEDVTQGTSLAGPVQSKFDRPKKLKVKSLYHVLASVGNTRTCIHLGFEEKFVGVVRDIHLSQFRRRG